jgi:hypothetical protein
MATWGLKLLNFTGLHLAAQRCSAVLSLQGKKGCLHMQRRGVLAHANETRAKKQHTQGRTRHRADLYSHASLP